MHKLDRYNSAATEYIGKLHAAIDGTADANDLIPASAAVQDALADIRNFTNSELDFVDATSAYIKGLVDAVKGRGSDTLGDIEASWKAASLRGLVNSVIGDKPAQIAVG